MIQLDDNGLCTGQFRIPSSIPVRCYPGSSTCDAASEDTTRSFNAMPGDINGCCYDENMDGNFTRIASPDMMYFSLNGGECRSCDGKSH